MSKSSDSLEKLLLKVYELSEEIAYLETAPESIRGEVERRVEVLSNIDPKFFVLGPAQGELPADQAENLKELKILRERLELIPGVLRRCNIKLASRLKDLQEAVEAETSALRTIALKRRERFEKETAAQLQEQFGESDATRRMVIEAVRSCGPNQAIESMRHLSDKPELAARTLIEVRESLEGNQTAANSAKVVA